jgi:hypothetical protein
MGVRSLRGKLGEDKHVEVTLESLVGEIERHHILRGR